MRKFPRQGRKSGHQKQRRDRSYLRSRLTIRLNGSAQDGGRSALGAPARADLILANGRICPCDLLQSVVTFAQCRFQLGFEAIGRGTQVVPALAGRLGEGRLSEMGGIAHAGAILLGLDLSIKVAGHAVEFADHVFEIGNLARLLVGGKALHSQR
jgi:hypothetical protein